MNAQLTPPRPNILLVEPQEATRGLLYAAAAPFGLVESYGQFEAARARVSRGGFDFLLTNVRLGAFNGVHLVYLSSPELGPARSIVYSAERDPGLARQIQRAGAFYETLECLSVTLTAYLSNRLPEQDRRDASFLDRRRIFRGGRRCWDHHLASPSH